MTRALNRTTADLSSYPDLVVIYLGMRVNAPRGVRTLTSFGPKIRKSVEAQPDGLLLHENLLFSLFPPHAECVSTGVTSTASSGGPGPCRTGSGGSSSCETGAAPAFGMRPTSAAAR
jgi:hypothetical protein